MFQFNFKTTKALLIGLLFISIFSFSTCDDDPDPTPETADFSAQLTNLTTNVILAIYADLAGKSGTLLSEVEKLQIDPTAVNLNNARGAWRDARAPWEKSEGFLFGPVDTKGIDPAIDDWPVNVIDLDGVLASNDELNEPFIELLETGLKGFHTIEYLLWNTDGSKEIGDFTTRELEYLVATVANLKIKTGILSDSWAVGGEDYGSNLINAGEAGSLFISQKAALQQLLEGIIAIADEVGSGKIAGPLGDISPVPVEEESRFSHNSKNDFANNIRSISNVYNGSYNIGSGGLSDIIKAENVTIDQNVLVAITDAINAIENIQGNFSDAIFDNRTDVENAKNKVLALKQILEQDVTPIITGL